MKNQDLDSLQHELHRVMGLPVVRDFSASNLILLCHCYGVQLLKLSDAIQQDRMVSVVRSEKGSGLTNPQEARCDQSRLNTFWSKSESMDCPSAKLPSEKEMTLNWQEVYEVLEEAFNDEQQQRKGCELLQTLDYKISLRHSNPNQLSSKLITWLQQAHRFKDQQLKGIYYRLLNLSFEDSKDEQTFQTFTELIHTEIESIFEMRNKYIRTIEELNSQITDLIAETTKKQIEEGCRESVQEVPQSAIAFGRRRLLREENSTEQKKFKLMEERRSLERNVEDMLAELLALKSDNEDLRARLFERDKQLNGLLMRNGMRDNSATCQFDTSNRRQFILHSLEKQLSILLVQLSNTTDNKFLKKALPAIKTDIDNEEDVLTAMTALNELLEDAARRSAVPYTAASADPLERQLGSIVNMLDRLVVSQGKHSRDMDLIQNLFIEFRTLEASINAEIRAELLGPKLMGSIARLQKMIGRADRKMQRLLEVEKGYLLELLGELVPTDRAMDTGMSTAHSTDEHILTEQNKSLQQELNTLKQQNEQLKLRLAESAQREKDIGIKRDEISKLMVDASRRLVTMQKDIQKSQAQRNELLSEVKHLRQNFREGKQNVRDQVVQKEFEIGKLARQLKHMEQLMEEQRRSFNQQRTRLAEQIQLTGSKLQDIQKLADRKLCTAEKEQRAHRGTPTLRRKMI